MQNLTQIHFTDHNFLPKATWQASIKHSKYEQQVSHEAGLLAYSYKP
jgi:hypothetical protein